jgi:hypothetical protein
MKELEAEGSSCNGTQIVYFSRERLPLHCRMLALTDVTDDARPLLIHCTHLCFA